MQSPGTVRTTALDSWYLPDFLPVQGPLFAIQDRSKTNPGPQKHHERYLSTTAEGLSFVLAERKLHNGRFIFISYLWHRLDINVLAPVRRTSELLFVFISDFVDRISSYFTEIHKRVELFRSSFLKRVYYI